MKLNNQTKPLDEMTDDEYGLAKLYCTVKNEAGEFESFNRCRNCTLVNYERDCNSNPI
ncbi:MAG: hypothetical protein FWE92_05725 [Defluviitaleaceae bacterium]|nr:hypothetical protein [Defluviitaleaceae bacterium]